MKLTRILLSLIAMGSAVAGASCGDETTPDDDGGDGTDEQSITVTLPVFKIPVGESFRCYYSDVITTEELSVVNASGVQVEGGHHLSVYYVDNERPVGLEDCTSAEMLDWHFVVGAGGEGNENAQLQLPEGLAFRIPPGKQLLVQAHYINVTGEEMDSADEITIGLTDPSKVEAYAADFVIDDDRFEIEPHGELTTTMTCEVPQDVSLTLLLGHMHEQGKHFKLEKVDAAGQTLEVLYEEDWLPAYASHPPMLSFGKEEPLQFTKGTRLRQTCYWQNGTDQKLLFPTEMCIGFGYYFPGTERVMCERIEDAP